MPYWIWFLSGTAMLVVEILIPHFVVIWFAIAALLTGIIAYWVSNTTLQLAIFAALSTVSFVSGWFCLRKNMNLRAVGDKDSIIGEAGTVVSSDVQSPSHGRVRFQGPIKGDEVWDFSSEDPIVTGDRCVVTEILGSRVKVKKA
jgi:hypothetical protein